MGFDVCRTCSGTDFIKLPTYKRDWQFCKACGTAFPTERKKYPFSFLPWDDLKIQSKLDAEKMYDYFVEDIHIEISEREGVEFIEQYINPNNIDLSAKSLLDISGGNGHFVKQLENKGAKVCLTEFNKKTVEYARKTHNFEAVFEYDLNRDELSQTVDRKFDIILARACIMFCDDLPKFVDQLKKCLNPGGIVIINHSVVPTLGVIVRVQLDEFSYSALRQPETVVDSFQKEGLDCVYRFDETDPSSYVYDHDLLSHWMALHYFYEIRGAKILKENRQFSFPARDRRRSTMIFKLDK